MPKLSLQSLWHDYLILREITVSAYFSDACTHIVSAFSGYNFSGSLIVISTLKSSPHIFKVSLLATVQLQFALTRYNHWCCGVSLVANGVETMSAGSLVLIHVKWREEAGEERMRMKETVMNSEWRRLVWAYADPSTPFNFYFSTSFTQARAEICPSPRSLI